MRILLAQNGHYVPTHGGGTKANRMWLEELARKGHPCRAVARSTGAQGARTRAEFLDQLAAHGTQLSSSAGDTDVFRYEGVEVHAVTDVPRLRDALVRQIGEFEPTWVLVSTADPGQVLLESALQSCPGRVIYIAHTPQMFPFGPESFWPSAAGTELLRRTAAIVTIGRTTASYVQEFTGITPVVIHPPSYGPGPFADYGVRNQGCITLVNPSAVKGLPIFLALAARLPQQEFAVLLGWSTTREDREALTGLPNVRVWEAVRDIDEVFARTRILLVPSLYREGFGLIATEAMLRGIPVLASDHGGLRDAKLGVDYLLPIRPIAKYEARYDDRHYPIPVIPEQDVGPWVEALQRLLLDPEHYARLSRASRDAALAFVAGLESEPFESFLRDLSSAANSAGVQEARASSGPSDQAGDGSEKSRELRDRIASLSPERRALLAMRLRKQTSANE